MNFSSRKAVDADLPFLIQLRRTTMREHYVREGLAYIEKEQNQRIMNYYELAQVIVFDGQDIGLVKIDRRETAWQLKQIQILPAFQNKGFGSKIVRQILDDARKERASVELGVLKNNPAKRFYERLGFSVVEEKERAYVMRFV